MQGLTGDASANRVINVSFITAVTLLPAAPSSQASRDRVQSPERPWKETTSGKTSGKEKDLP